MDHRTARVQDTSAYHPAAVRRTHATLIVLAGALTACGGGSEAPGKLVKTDAGGEKRTKTDPKTGLQFEVYSSPKDFGGGSVLTVRATDATSDATIARLTEKPSVAVSCRVRGAQVRYFPQPWKRAERKVASALVVDGDKSAARLAQTCQLVLGVSGPNGTIEFGQETSDAFSLVRF